ncbi:DegT/DnrJ/EryC1/StrS family aminotransferase [Bradyrhizobium sp. RDT46]|uniref:DegT/DnrJ/EryC1/StrS family aminotransferase n=1 Tax=Bradyrhizobium sp. RDT46 TaxID=3341829 RepID=UPI0035C7883E
MEGVFQRGDFIGGAAVGKLEEELSAYLGSPHVVTLNSGTDALILALRALDIGPGDEVITPRIRSWRRPPRSSRSAPRRCLRTCCRTRTSIRPRSRPRSRRAPRRSCRCI